MSADLTLALALMRGNNCAVDRPELLRTGAGVGFTKPILAGDLSEYLHGGLSPAQREAMAVAGGRRG